MKQAKRFVLGIFVAAVLVVQLFTGTVALAHNAGHIHTPSGACIDVGSGNHAHNPEHQDKIPGGGDEYGARWAAEQGNTPIHPRHCDDPRPGTHDHPSAIIQASDRS